MKKAIIDIDGVLNYYPKTFIKYVNDMRNSHYITLKDIKEHLSYNMYKILKEEYRKSTYKHEAEVRTGAQRLLTYLHNNGYLIYIITARELFKYNQLEKTILWLKDNDLYYDYIYCSQKKDFTIFEKFGHVDLVVEDNCDNINKIYKINGEECIYFNIINDENIDRTINNGFRISSLTDILEYI